MRKASLISVLFLLLTSAIAHAQGSDAEMADSMRANGKIYVVVLVLATIFAGIIVYLVRMDRKISQIEKNNN